MASYFTLNALFVLKIFTFLFLTFWSCLKTAWLEKWKKPGKQTIAVHILPNISRSKGNQTIKFGQLIDHNISNIFFEKSHTKCGGVTTPIPFSKKSKFSIFLDKYSG